MSRDHQHASSTRHQDRIHRIRRHLYVITTTTATAPPPRTSLFDITHVSRAAHVPFPQKCICTRPGEDPEFTLCVAYADEPRDVAYADELRVEDPVEDPT